VADYNPLLNPDKEPPAWVIGTIDVFSWALPILSAVLAIVGGCAALRNADQWAAGLSIAGGIIGALGVLATNWSSRIRDHRIAWTKSLAGLGVDMAEMAQRSRPFE
jgi:hypothetical protein